MMYSGDEDFGDEITSGIFPDDFETLNQNEVDDYRGEGDEPDMDFESDAKDEFPGGW